MKNAKQSIKNGKGSNTKAHSNTTNRDYYDDTGSGYDYEDEEYGEDYGYGNYYDENSNSAKEGLGMFRSSNKGNHLPSIKDVFFVFGVFRPIAFSRIFSKGVPRTGRDG